MTATLTATDAQLQQRRRDLETKHPRGRSIEDRRRTAIHEAGHAFVAVKAGATDVEATIVPDQQGTSYGRVEFDRDDLSNEAVAAICAGGFIAEQLLLGGSNCVGVGLVGPDASITQEHTPDSATQVFIASEVRAVMSANLGSLGRLAESLLNRETMAHHEIVAIVGERLAYRNTSGW